MGFFSKKPDYSKEIENHEKSLNYLDYWIIFNILVIIPIGEVTFSLVDLIYDFIDKFRKNGNR